MNILKLWLIIITLFLFSVTICNADVWIRTIYESIADLDTSKNVATNLLLSKDRALVEISGKKNNMVIIFRKDKGLMWVINKQNATYFEITEDDLQKLKSQFEEIEQEMSEKLKNMPAEKRKMFEQMMQEQKPAKKDSKLIYKKKKSGKKIYKWNCIQYDVFENSKKVKELWIVDWEQLEFKRDEFKILYEMGDFFRTISPGNGGVFDIGPKEWHEEGGFKGFPIQIINFTGGAKRDKLSVTEIAWYERFRDSIFELPDGYSKKGQPWSKMEEKKLPK